MNLTQQDVQTVSHFASEEVVTTVTTTTQKFFHQYIQILQL